MMMFKIMLHVYRATNCKRW